MNFIEMFGIPGSGKSFYAEKIASEKEIPSYTDFSNSLFNKGYLKIFVHLRLSNAVEPDMSKQIFKLYSPYQKNKNQFGFNVNLETYLHQLMYTYHIQKKMAKNDKKMVFDEGVLHRIIAIESEFCVPHTVSSTALRYLSDTYDMKYFFVRCNYKTAYLRVLNRNRKNAPMDFLRNEDLEKFLKVYDKVCLKFSSELTKVTVIENDKV